MPYKIDHLPEVTLTWELTPDSVTCREIPDYTPTLFVGTGVDSLFGAVEPPDPDDGLAADLLKLSEFLSMLPSVVDVRVEHWRQTFRSEPALVLCIDVDHVGDVTDIAHRVHQFGDPGQFTCYNVDFSWEFRYCLEQGSDPTPNRPPRTLELSLPSHQLEVEALTQLEVDGDEIGSAIPEVLDGLTGRLAETEPDILILSSSQLVPLLYKAADSCDREFDLGRRSGYQQLAGESTYESYGRVGHSPARYNVPGRAIIDRSNTFFLSETNLKGCLDLVSRSWKPIQELA